MKALSFLQPWGTLVALSGHPDPEIRKLGKLIETRSWYTDYRGPLLIHVSQRWNDDVVRWVLYDDRAELIRRALRATGYGRLALLPLGCIIAVVDLVDVKRTTTVHPGEPERSYGDYTPGRFAWIMHNVRALPEPVPARGNRRLWVPDPALLEAIQAKLNVVGSISERGKPVAGN